MLTRADIEKYFTAEKQMALFFVVLGLLAVGLAVWFLFLQKNPVLKGMGLPFIVLGLLQAIAGYAVYQRSDKQRIDLVYAYDMNPSVLRQAELPRMEKVNSRFGIFLAVEVALLIAGVVLFFLYRQAPEKQWFYGLGLGLLLQGLVMLAGDGFAFSRARTYTTALKTLLEKGRVQPQL